MKLNREYNEAWIIEGKGEELFKKYVGYQNAGIKHLSDDYFSEEKKRRQEIRSGKEYKINQLEEALKAEHSAEWKMFKKPKVEKMLERLRNE